MAATAGRTKKINVFIGYHAIDEQLKKRLLKHLKVLERLHNVVLEHEVQPGSHIAEVVDRQLCAADMILLLLTGDFLGSEEHLRMIIEPAIKKASERVVVPVIMRSCLWKLTELAGMEVLPDSGVPLEEWQVKESAYRNVASELKHRIEHLKATLEIRDLQRENEDLRRQLSELNS